VPILYKIYRIGYYQGKRRMPQRERKNYCNIAQTQARPLYDAFQVDSCGNWSESAHWDVPADAVSGLYIAN
jgi:hypothetical protein